MEELIQKIKDYFKEKIDQNNSTMVDGVDCCYGIINIIKGEEM